MYIIQPSIPSPASVIALQRIRWNAISLALWWLLVRSPPWTATASLLAGREHGLENSAQTEWTTYIVRAVYALFLCNIVQAAFALLFTSSTSDAGSMTIVPQQTVYKSNVVTQSTLLDEQLKTQPSFPYALSANYINERARSNSRRTTHPDGPNTQPLADKQDSATMNRVPLSRLLASQDRNTTPGSSPSLHGGKANGFALQTPPIWASVHSREGRDSTIGSDITSGRRTIFSQATSNTDLDPISISVYKMKRASGLDSSSYLEGLESSQLSNSIIGL